MPPKMRGGRVGSRITRILAACVPDNHNVPSLDLEGPRQVAIASECPEVLNNLDIIGIGPSSPMYLNPACDQNVQPLFESPTTSTGCNQTLVELTPQRNRVDVNINEFIKPSIGENIKDLITLEGGAIKEPSNKEIIAEAESFDYFLCNKLTQMEFDKELCEPEIIENCQDTASMNLENTCQENLKEVDVAKGDILINIANTGFEDNQVYISKTQIETSLLQDMVGGDVPKDRVEQDPDYIVPSEENTSGSSEGDDRNDEPHPKKPKKTDSNLLTFSRKKVQKRKKNRNSGQEYTTAKNIPKTQRKMRDLRENCRNKCKEKIDENIRQTIFDEYWSLGTHDKRVAYVASLINVNETEITRNKVNNGKSTRNRLCTYIYNFEINGQRIVVCKCCFLNTLDETEKFISCTVINKLKSSSGITHTDKRGMHTPLHKTPQNKIDEIKSHINSFPAYESHYSRRHTEKKYLASDLNLSKMYNLYCEKYTEKPVSIKIYAREFNKLNLKFKKPKNDTCSRCDTLLAQEKYCSSEELKVNFKKELDEHLTLADLAYEAKAADKKKDLDNPSHITCAFDLQQVLQTPYLSTNKMFYLRQLATYNLTVHNCSSGESTHFMWPECTAGRGANEIASCVFAFLKSIPEEVKHIVLYSDTCGGQNKNSFICAMFHYVINLHQTLEIIDHKFLVPGHTHLECDVDHALIERTKKKTSIDIHLPRDWYQLVKSASKKNKFKVEIMDQDRFFSFSELVSRTGPLQVKNKDFKLRSISWLRYTKDSVVRFKNSLSDEEEFKEVKFLKKNRNESNMESFKLNDLYKAQRPISTKKKENLLQIVGLLDRDVQDYYRNLPTDKSIQNDTDPDVDRYLAPEEESEF